MTKICSKDAPSITDSQQDENLGKRTPIWKEPSNNLDDFPRLTGDLRNITCGVYKINMSSSYIHEHLEGNYQFLVHREDETLLE